MEEILWISVGVVLIIIVLGTMVSIIDNYDETANLNNLDMDMQKLKIRCDSVCASSLGTYLSQDVKLPRESLLYSNENRICVTVGPDIICKVCGCNLGEKTVEVNLTDAVFKEHTYSCFFRRRGGQNVTMDCKG